MTRPAKPVIELICVGSELLSGKVNTHQSYISLALAGIGLSLSRESSLPDELELLRGAIAESLSRADALIICGGLGPTFDDITREAVAGALNRPMHYKPALYAQIKKRFKRFRTKIAPENRRQAFVIQGAKVLKNDFGSAPGQLLSVPNPGRTFSKTIALLPGPFVELAPMFEQDVLPRLKKNYARNIFSRALQVHLSGIPESTADERLKILTRNPKTGRTFTILAGQGQVDFHALATAPSQAAADRDMAEIRRAIYRSVGEHIFGEGETSLESAVGQLLKRQKLTLAAAESCTAGLLSARITAVPGSSDYFKGAVVSYSNDLKANLLGVSEETLKKYGAVSAQCAKEMAEGARLVTGASIGISITGIAGPAGGSAKKPVGLVYIGLSGPSGTKSQVWESRFLGSRATIRQRAAASALHRLWRLLSDFD